MKHCQNSNHRLVSRVTQCGIPLRSDGAHFCLLKETEKSSALVTPHLL